jgi:hypothetical protein|tara:strand:- start:2890 stop:3024 length:135 start_codon:yes stop_codon:yes gene_type:complete
MNEEDLEIDFEDIDMRDLDSLVDDSWIDNLENTGSIQIDLDYLD